MKSTEFLYILMINEMTTFVPDQLKTEKMCKYTVKKVCRS